MRASPRSRRHWKIRRQQFRHPGMLLARLRRTPNQARQLGGTSGRSTLRGVSRQKAIALRFPYLFIFIPQCLSIQNTATISFARLPCLPILYRITVQRSQPTPCRAPLARWRRCVFSAVTGDRLKLKLPLLKQNREAAGAAEGNCLPPLQVACSMSECQQRSFLAPEALLALLLLLQAGPAVLLLLREDPHGLFDLPLLLEVEKAGEAVVGVVLVELEGDFEAGALLEHALVSVRELLAQRQVVLLQGVLPPGGQPELLLQVGEQEAALGGLADERQPQQHVLAHQRLDVPAHRGVGVVEQLLVHQHSRHRVRVHVLDQRGAAPHRLEDAPAHDHLHLLAALRFLLGVLRAEAPAARDHRVERVVGEGGLDQSHEGLLAAPALHRAVREEQALDAGRGDEVQAGERPAPLAHLPPELPPEGVLGGEHDRRAEVGVLTVHPKRGSANQSLNQQYSNPSRFYKHSLLSNLLTGNGHCPPKRTPACPRGLIPANFQQVGREGRVCPG